MDDPEPVAEESNGHQPEEAPGERTISGPLPHDALARYALNVPAQEALAIRAYVEDQTRDDEVITSRKSRPSGSTAGITLCVMSGPIARWRP